MEEINETNLIKRIQNGDVQAFSIVVKHYQKQVFSLIIQIVSCREEAEELTQDVFLKIFKKLDSFKGKSSLSTWIYRIAWNSAISYTRKKRIYFPVKDENVFSQIPDETVDEWLSKENDEKLLTLIEEALKELATEERLLLSLFYFDNKSIMAISEITGFTVNNVKIKLFRIRKKVAVLVKEKGYEEG